MSDSSKNPAPHAVVLGAGGFIGGRLCQRLRENSLPVSGFGSRDCNLLDTKQTRSVLSDFETPYAIVMCSGISRVRDPSVDAMLHNMQMARNLIAAMKTPPTSVIFLSSADVYGLPAAELPITEQTPPRPGTFYGHSKLVSEAILSQGRSDWGAAAPPVANLRLPGVYGPGDQGASVVGGFVQRLKQGRPITLSAGGKTKRDLIHVDDLCSLITRLIRNPFHGILNVATGRAVSIRELAAMAAKELGVEADFESSAPNPARDHDLVFDTARLNAAAPDVVFRTLDQGVRDCVDSGDCEEQS